MENIVRLTIEADRNGKKVYFELQIPEDVVLSYSPATEEILHMYIRSTFNMMRDKLKETDGGKV